VQIDIEEFVCNDELSDVGRLSAIIIETMRHHGTITLHTEELISGEEIGLFDLLDSLCSYYNWDPTQIQLSYQNYRELENETRYTVKRIVHSGEQIWPGTLNDTKNVLQLRDWNKEEMFGMFTGRMNFTRLYAHDKLRKFRYKDQCLSSMNQAPSDFRVNQRVLLQYLKESGTSWDEIKDIEPYSDISEVITPPITLARQQFIGWEDIYEKIGIEIVCETAESQNIVAFTEKLIRPMAYKRPFLLIGSPGLAHELADENSFIMQKLKTLPIPVGPIRFFQNVIPLNYDNLAGAERVDAVFEILDGLIESGMIDTILDDCKDDIEWNHKIAYDWLKNGYNPEGLLNE